MAKNYTLKNIKLPKDKLFDKLSNSNLSFNGKGKNIFGKVGKDKTISQPGKLKSASKRSVKQFGK